VKKVFAQEELKKELERIRKEGKKKLPLPTVALTFLHVGHVRYLRDAKKTADVLILALNSDSSVRTIKGEKSGL
jgi:bifunctional ADP-heptose synthase (sugar kinase/adenylyltransferase)